MANVLITGCGGGIGLLSAAHFARQGDRVFATLRSPAKARELERTRRAESLPIEILTLDVLDPASVEEAVKQVEAEGGVDILINNAGIEVRSSIEDADEEKIRLQFDTNVFGALRLIRAVLPAMRERGAGTIVNVSSIAGLVGRPYGGLYAASKHALEAISETLHLEVGVLGIRVILIEPGQYDTPLHDSYVYPESFNSDSPYWERCQRFESALSKLSPDGQRADPQEVAECIYHAVHDPEPRLRYLVGQDALLIAGVHKEKSFEEFEATMRAALDWHD